MVAWQRLIPKFLKFGAIIGLGIEVTVASQALARPLDNEFSITVSPTPLPDPEPNTHPTPNPSVSPDLSIEGRIPTPNPSHRPPSKTPHSRESYRTWQDWQMRDLIK